MNTVSDYCRRRYRQAGRAPCRDRRTCGCARDWRRGGGTGNPTRKWPRMIRSSWRPRTDHARRRASPKIYHIVHVDRLAPILASGGLLCDAEIVQANAAGTTIGMSGIKQRRLNELRLTSHPDLHVGACVPFLLLPTSVMLYLIYQANHLELSYRGGQGPIVHWRRTCANRWRGPKRTVCVGPSRFQRGSLLLRGSMRFGAIARNRLGCGSGQPVGRQRHLAPRSRRVSRPNS